MAAAFSSTCRGPLATAAGRQAQPLQAALARHGRGFIRDARRPGGMGWTGTDAASASAMPIRACRRSGCARCCRRNVPPTRPPNSAPRSSPRARYEAHRIALGIPRGGVDFGYGDAFPHEADMDQLGGVDFTKGCYVGQEVVSRMEHRGIARTRAVPVRSTARRRRPARRSWPASARSARWVARRRPRARALCASTGSAEALSRGESLLAGGVPIRPIKPDWARFAFPEGSKAAE